MFLYFFNNIISVNRFFCLYEFGGEVGEGLVSLYGLILINDASKNSFSPNIYIQTYILEKKYMYIKHYKRVTLPEIMINGEELIKYGGSVM